jgi:hypothetical protein
VPWLRRSLSGRNKDALHRFLERCDFPCQLHRDGRIRELASVPAWWFQLVTPREPHLEIEEAGVWTSFAPLQLSTLPLVFVMTPPDAPQDPPSDFLWELPIVADASGYDRWQEEKAEQVRAFEQQWGIPLGKRVRVELKGAVGDLIGVLKSDFSHPAKQRGIYLRMGTHAFHSTQIISVVSLE